VLLYNKFNRNGGYVFEFPMANQIARATADSAHIHTVNFTVTLFLLLTLLGTIVAFYIYFMLKRQRKQRENLLATMNNEILEKVNQNHEVRLELANRNGWGTPMIISLSTPETSRVIRALDRILEEQEDLEEAPLTQE